ncbi:Protein of unknown function [Gryllus bimaculatus]|nr:Protein of unknown function [Gryllus bimaculatus]
MSGMLASRVRFEQVLPMFVLLASLMLVKCVSGVELLETSTDTPISSTSEDSKTLSTDVTGHASTLDPTPTSTDIKSTSLAATLASSTFSANNANLPPVYTIPPEKENITNLNNSTTASTVLSSTVSSTEPSTLTHTQSTEVGATKSTSTTTEKSEVVVSTSGSASSTEENLTKDDTRHAAEAPSSGSSSPGHAVSSLTTDQQVSSISSEGHKTTVAHKSSKMTNLTSVSASTTSNSVESTLSPVDLEVTSTTSESATMSTTYVEHTSPNNIELSVNMTCKDNNECNAKKHLTCNVLTGRCTCMNGYSPMGPTSCGKKLGDVCDRNCDAQNSRCKLVGDKYICVCEEGLTASTDGTFCYGKPLMFEDVCDHSANCTDVGSRVICKNFACVCEENYVRWHGQCLEKIDRLDVPCNVDTQVCFSESESDSANKKICLNGFCRCLLGAPCNATTHVCHKDDDGANQTLQCHNGICQCKDIFLLEDGKCKKKIGLLGAPCNATADICFFKEDGNQQKTHCKDGVCQCKAEFALTDKKCQKLKSGNNHAETRFIGRIAWIPLIAVISVMR